MIKRKLEHFLGLEPKQLELKHFILHQEIAIQPPENLTVMIMYMPVLFEYFKNIVGQKKVRLSMLLWATEINLSTSTLPPIFTVLAVVFVSGASLHELYACCERLVPLFEGGKAVPIIGKM